MMRAVVVCAMLALLPTAMVFADEARQMLKDSPGRDVVTANCLACHSVDYIAMNAGIQDRAGWQATLTKMRTVMAAPISDDDAASILEYLAKNYARP